MVGQTEFNLTFKGATTGTVTYTGTTADATAIPTALNGLCVGGVVSSIGVSRPVPAPLLGSFCRNLAGSVQQPLISCWVISQDLVLTSPIAGFLKST